MLEERKQLKMEASAATIELSRIDQSHTIELSRTNQSDNDQGHSVHTEQSGTAAHRINNEILFPPQG